VAQYIHIIDTPAEESKSSHFVFIDWPLHSLQLQKSEIWHSSASWINLQGLFIHILCPQLIFSLCWNKNKSFGTEPWGGDNSKTNTECYSYHCPEHCSCYGMSQWMQAF